jgi:hypothetical protein
VNDVNPNPHCFIAITMHIAQPCGGRGKWCYLYLPEDLLNKNVSLTLFIIKSILKMICLMKNSETKKFVKIFCEAF